MFMGVGGGESKHLNFYTIIIFKHFCLLVKKLKR